LAQLAKEKMHAPVLLFAASATTKSEGTNPIPQSGAATFFFKTNPISHLERFTGLYVSVP
jgi:hypothetical protein